MPPTSVGTFRFLKRKHLICAVHTRKLSLSNFGRIRSLQETTSFQSAIQDFRYFPPILNKYLTILLVNANTAFAFLIRRRRSFQWKSLARTYKIIPKKIDQQKATHRALLM